MDNIETAKVDKSTIEVVETIPEAVLPAVKYNIAFLKQQLVDIEAQRERDNASRDDEVAKVQALLDECDRLGITG